MAKGKASKGNVALWSAQGLLAAVFLFAGSMKLAMPMEMLAEVSPLPALFIKFIAVCEILGALGLVLPGIFRTHRELTPLAAMGLIVIMVGATVSTILFSQPGALMPFVVGILAAVVAYGRRGALAGSRYAAAAQPSSLRIARTEPARLSA